MNAAMAATLLALVMCVQLARCVEVTEGATQVLAAPAGQTAWKAPWFCHGLDCPRYRVSRNISNKVELREYDAGELGGRRCRAKSAPSGHVPRALSALTSLASAAPLPSSPSCLAAAQFCQASGSRPLLVASISTRQSRQGSW